MVDQVQSERPTPVLPWSELETEAKVERMREVVKSLMRQVATLEQNLDILRNHDHLNGKVVASPYNLSYQTANRSEIIGQWF